MCKTHAVLGSKLKIYFLEFGFSEENWEVTSSSYLEGIIIAFLIVLQNSIIIDQQWVYHLINK